MSLVDRLRGILGGGKGGAPAGPGRGDPGRGGHGTISCIEALEKVHDYLDGELDGETLADVAHHFRICQECYPHLRLEERFRELLLGVQAAERCPQQVRVQIMEMLGGEAAEGGGVG